MIELLIVRYSVCPILESLSFSISFAVWAMGPKARVQVLYKWIAITNSLLQYDYCLSKKFVNLVFSR